MDKTILYRVLIELLRFAAEVNVAHEMETGETLESFEALRD